MRSFGRKLRRSVASMTHSSPLSRSARLDVRDLDPVDERLEEEVLEVLLEAEPALGKASRQTQMSC